MASQPKRPSAIPCLFRSQRPGTRRLFLRVPGLSAELSLDSALDSAPASPALPELLRQPRFELAFLLAGNKTCLEALEMQPSLKRPCPGDTGCDAAACPVAVTSSLRSQSWGASRQLLWVMETWAGVREFNILLRGFNILPRCFRESRG